MKASIFQTERVELAQDGKYFASGFSVFKDSESPLLVNSPPDVSWENTLVQVLPEKCKYFFFFFLNLPRGHWLCQGLLMIITSCSWNSGGRGYSKGSLRSWGDVSIPTFVVFMLMVLLYFFFKD